MDCSNGVPSSAITIKHNNEEITDAGIGEGTIDAVFKTIDRITNINGLLRIALSIFKF
jgi:2-isopropylmalate synthase